MKMKPLFLIDCDGVMLDYNLAFKNHYEKIYNKVLTLTKPNSYLAVDVWGVGEMTKENYNHFKNESVKLGIWENMPALPDALEFVQELSQYFTVWCLTSMPTEFEQARLKNLQNLGFPIEKVIATSRIGKENPKKKFVEELKPMYFMDDLLQNFVDIDKKLKTKLIYLDWKHDDSPNKNYDHLNPHMTIHRYNDFFAKSSYYTQHKKFLNLQLSFNDTPYLNQYNDTISADDIPATYLLKEYIYRLHKKYVNHYLEGEFTKKDNNALFSSAKRLKKELPDWTVQYNGKEVDL